MYLRIQQMYNLTISNREKITIAIVAVIYKELHTSGISVIGKELTSSGNSDAATALGF